MRKPAVRLHKPTRRGAALFLAFLSIVLGIVGLALSFRATVPSSSVAHLPVDEQLKSVLAQSTTDIDKLKTIDSSLGFKLTYNPTILDGQGQTTDASSDDKWISGKTYTEEELYERRDYSIVKFRPKEKDEEHLFAQPELTILTNIRKAYWENRMKLPENAAKTKLEVFVDDTIASRGKDGYKVADRQDITINGAAYKLVTFDYQSGSFGVGYKSTSRFYFTVQNDRPYYISIHNMQNDSNGYIAQFETIINTVTFEGLDEDKLAAVRADQADNVLAATDSLPAGTGNMPNPLDAKALLDVVARNQIAVVRIGTIYCAQIDLLLTGGSVGGRVDTACAAGIGSGSIVTGDGYVATNGHVVQLSKTSALTSYIGMAKDIDDLIKRINPVVEYLVKRGKITTTQKDALIAAIKNKDPKGLQAALGLGEAVGENYMTAHNDRYSYVVQLSNEPIRIKDTQASRLEFVYATSNITARFVAANYDHLLSADKIAQSTKSDVALLKMEGQFPVVSVGSLSTVQPPDRLIAIGFPGFVDKGLSTVQKHTVPSITQGYAESVRAQSLTSPYKLVLTSVPIAQGNSGGPMFNEQGVQIGLNTYSILPCADKKCFGKGIARDVDDLKKLATDNGVVLGVSGSLAQEWQAGIEALKKDDFTGAQQKFEKVSNEYHGNYLAAALRDVAASQTNGGSHAGSSSSPGSSGSTTDVQGVNGEGTDQPSSAHAMAQVHILGTTQSPLVVRIVSVVLIVAGGVLLVIQKKFRGTKAKDQPIATVPQSQPSEVSPQQPPTPAQPSEQVVITPEQDAKTDD